MFSQKIYLVRWVYCATHLITTTLHAIIGSIFLVPSPVSTKAETQNEVKIKS